jgi:hypothetical protein
MPRRRCRGIRCRTAGRRPGPAGGQRCIERLGEVGQLTEGGRLNTARARRRDGRLLKASRRFWLASNWACGEPDAVGAARPVRGAGRENGPAGTLALRPGSAPPRLPRPWPTALVEEDSRRDRGAPILGNRRSASLLFPASREEATRPGLRTLDALRGAGKSLGDRPRRGPDHRGRVGCGP